MSLRILQLRQYFYHWRQRRPVRRLGSLVLFLFILPFRFAFLKLRQLAWRRGQRQRVVVIQLAGLGDLLMLTPALAALHAGQSSTQIELITLHEFVRVAFARHPRLHRISLLPNYSGGWIIRKFAGDGRAGLLAATLWYYPELLLRHSFACYDVGINFGMSDFDRKVGNALLFLLGVPRRIGSRGASEDLLTDALTVDVTATHRAAAYLSFLKPLAVSSESSAYEYPVGQDNLRMVTPALRSAGVDRSKPLAVIHPGGKLHINSRRWPAEYYARVVDFLTTHEGFEVVLTGDRDDQVVCQEIADQSQAGVTSLAGRFSFAETAALLSICQVFITNDTATLHLAAAVQVPRVVAIFGPTNPDLLAPQNDRTVVLRSDLPCAPCMGGLIDSRTERCWLDQKEQCLWLITPDQVIGVLEIFYREPALRLARA
jgi:ADP-heptose:LPS heptosyltransferase